MPAQMLGEQVQQRPRGRRPRRRSRSGDGVVLANRKTEICLHWQTGTCPYGAGSCAFAHGLGELRHPTLDDEAIARSVSEDSGSCPSSRDTSLSSRCGGVIGRVPHSPCERRLPTFVDLSTGNTPVRGSRHTRHWSSPATRQPHGYYSNGQPRTPHHQRSRSYPSPASSDFSDSYGFGVAVDAPPVSPQCYHREAAPPRSPRCSSFTDRRQRTSAAPAAEPPRAPPGGHGGRYARRVVYSYGSSPAGRAAPASPASWAHAGMRQQPGGGGGSGGGGGGRTGAN
ncbi:unnamed protein product, partial [Ectocarpus sp. 12 AP-2014]